MYNTGVVRQNEHQLHIQYGSKVWSHKHMCNVHNRWYTVSKQQIAISYLIQLKKKVFLFLFDDWITCKSIQRPPMKLNILPWYFQSQPPFKLYLSKPPFPNHLAIFMLLGLYSCQTYHKNKMLSLIFLNSATQRTFKYPTNWYFVCNEQ
jgi:hypothetical protein